MPGQNSDVAEILDDGDPVNLSRRTAMIQNGQETVAAETADEEFIQIKVPKLKSQNSNATMKNRKDHGEDSFVQMLKATESHTENKFSLKTDLNESAVDKVGPDKQFYMNTELCKLPHHEIYSCGVCGEQFKSPWVLKDHMHIHSGQMYACEFCPIQFKDFWQLKQHRLVHSEKQHQYGLGRGEFKSPLAAEDSVSELESYNDGSNIGMLSQENRSQDEKMSYDKRARMKSASREPTANDRQKVRIDIIDDIMKDSNEGKDDMENEVTRVPAELQYYSNEIISKFKKFKTESQHCANGHFVGSEEQFLETNAVHAIIEGSNKKNLDSPENLKRNVDAYTLREDRPASGDNNFVEAHMKEDKTASVENRNNSNKSKYHKSRKKIKSDKSQYFAKKSETDQTKDLETELPHESNDHDADISDDPYSGETDIEAEVSSVDDISILREIQTESQNFADGSSTSLGLMEDQLSETKAIYTVICANNVENSRKFGNLTRNEELNVLRENRSASFEKSNNKLVPNPKTHFKEDKTIVSVKKKRSDNNKSKHHGCRRKFKSDKNQNLAVKPKKGLKTELSHKNNITAADKSADPYLGESDEDSAEILEAAEITDEEQTYDSITDKATSDACKSKKKENDLYSCGICGKQYKVPAVLRNHMLVHSEDRPFACEECPSKFKSRWLLKQHLLVHSDEKPYACELCPSKFKSPSILKQHVRKHSGDRPYECEICDSKCKSRWQLKQHMMVHSDVRPFSCVLCNYSFKSKWRLKQHVMVHSKIKLYSCDVCNVDFKSASQLNTHMDVHKGGQDYTCEVCGNNYKSKWHLKQHMLSHTGEKPNTCQLCDQSFTQLSSLKAHMLEHTGERNFACDVCDKTFYTTHQLKRHVLSHAEEKPFPCCLCERTFVTKSQLDRHVLTHTGEKNFACEICEKRFITNGDLSEHMNTHTKERLHACYICCKMFAKMGNLNRHLLSHAGIKPFKCEICDKSFSTKAYLSKHARVHSGEKPFTCEVCDKRFTMLNNLSQHRLIHTGVKPHSCHICNKQFTTSSHVKQHMKKHLRQKSRELKDKTSSDVASLSKPFDIESIPKILEIGLSEDFTGKIAAGHGASQFQSFELKDVKSLDMLANTKPHDTELVSESL